MLSSVYSAGNFGIDGYLVTVEVNCLNRMQIFELVGLPDLAVKESKERVRTACENSGFRFPSCELLVNLAPADRKKEGSFFDVAILVGILRGAKTIREDVDLSQKCFVGELSLSGELRAVHGALCLCVAAKEAGMKEIYVPAENAAEAAVVDGIDVYAVRDMRQLVAHLNGTDPMTPVVTDREKLFAGSENELDFSDVRGQRFAKRAMEIAAAGGHNILLIGPPGTGKSMLAKRLPTILPSLSFEEAVEVTKIHSVSGNLPQGVSLLCTRPFRSPHHTMSAVSLVGGGAIPMPGEISLADRGVLFLDELPEFTKQVTDSLRQPLEDQKVTITRAMGRVTYPCSFMLVCAMNPCRCGNFGNPNKKCTCSPADIKRYLSRVSGPLLDRMDIQIELPSVTFSELSVKDDGAERSEAIRERVVAARNMATERYRGHLGEGGAVYCNAQLDAAGIRKYCIADDEAKNLLQSAYDRLGMSARGYDRIMRVARTIADLDGAEVIGGAHIAEAIQLRSLDRKYWGKL